MSRVVPRSVKIIIFVIFIAQVLGHEQVEPELEGGYIASLFGRNNKEDPVAEKIKQVLDKLLMIEKSQSAANLEIKEKIEALEHQHFELAEVFLRFSNRLNEIGRKSNESKAENGNILIWLNEKILEVEKRFELLEKRQDEKAAEISKQIRDLSDKSTLSNTERDAKWLSDLKNLIGDQTKNLDFNQNFNQVHLKLEDLQKIGNEKLNVVIEKLNELHSSYITSTSDSAESLKTLQSLNESVSLLVSLEKEELDILGHLNESIVSTSNLCALDADDKIGHLYEAINSYSGCAEAVKTNGHSGVYLIRSPRKKHSIFEAFCLKDPKGKGEAWTLMMRRQQNSSDFVDFKRNWTEYRNGFGDPEHDYWLGLEQIYDLTNSSKHEFWRCTDSWKGVSNNAYYTDFSIASDADEFRLSALKWKEGQSDNFCSDVPFNTYDRGNTTYISEDNGSGYWGYCPLNYNRQKANKGRFDIGLRVGGIDVAYVHLAIRPLNV